MMLSMAYVKSREGGDVCCRHSASIFTLSPISEFTFVEAFSLFPTEADFLDFEWTDGGLTSYERGGEWMPY
jgi:hypothetical protein